jgi:dipeptidyl aminopeptidase/acylaminoacyl peptidase
MLAAWLLCLAVAPGARGQELRHSGDRIRAPLPLDLVASLRGHSRAPLDLSPDGTWLAHTVHTDESIARDSVGFLYTATGVPLSEGDARTEATLTHTATGELVVLGGASSSSWAPAWSPDGGSVAFYSDEDGEAGVWIWDRHTGAARRLTGRIARPLMGSEGPRWSPDGEHLLVKVLPDGVSIAEANARAAGGRPASPADRIERDLPSVVVSRVTPDRPARESEGEPPPGPATGGVSRAVDLVAIDVASGRVRPLAEGVTVGYYAWAPDGARVAYTVVKGVEPNTEQSIFDFRLSHLGSNESRTLVVNARMAFSLAWTWAPDGRSIAYVTGGPLASGEIVLVSVEDGATRPVGGRNASSAGGSGEAPPQWSADGAHLYVVADGELWRIPTDSGPAGRVARIAGWRLERLIGAFTGSKLWTTGRGRSAWVIAREIGGERSGIFSVDLETGRTSPGLVEAKRYSTLPYDLAASDATGEIAFVSTDQQHPTDVWLLDTETGRARQATHLNPELERYELGTVRILEWQGPNGRPLRGALLLPPGYEEGRRIPLVVYAYGGAMGSTSARTFGLQESPAFNMHVLATRGYAVLYPDAPLRVGSAAADIVATIMPGVDAAIEAGYADPERLAVMGQSYGAYTTLVLLTATTRFRAAVISAAVTHPNLFADYLRNPAFFEQGQGRMGATIWERPDLYREGSPLFRFDRIETALLMAQGDRDGDLVPSRAIHAAFERLGKPFEHRLYLGEGHVISRKANVIDFWQRRLEFLDEHLTPTPGS